MAAPSDARDDQLTRYLLGELPDDETERLDEATVVDDVLAAKLRLAEDELVDAHARGRLTGERRRRFEAIYLASPRRREKAAFARRFVTAIDDEVSQVDAVAAGPSPRRTSIRWIVPALAAAVALCLGTGALLVQHARLQTTLTEVRQQLNAADRQLAALSGELAIQQRSAAAAQGSHAREAQVPPPQPLAAVAVALVLMPQTRGIGPVPAVAVSRGSGTVPLALGVEDAGAAPFDAELRDPKSNRIVWRSGPLAADRTARATLLGIAVPSDVLKSQHYVIDVHSGRRGRAFVDSYAFEVVRR